MPLAILGRKMGMTRVYDRTGRNVPVTVILAGPNQVCQIKTVDTDGYDAVQLAFEEVKGRASTIPLIGHDAKAGLGPRRVHREVRVQSQELAGLEPGRPVTVSIFKDVRFVDVVATSKGKGFAGPMRRWGFKGQPDSHGTERKHRSPGSIGSRACARGTGPPKKGTHMAGRLGGDRVTVRSLELIGTDDERNLILVKGPVPGCTRGLVLVREAVRLSKRKAKAPAAS